MTLIIAAVVALMLVNSPLSGGWRALLHSPVLGLTVTEWVDDALMAVFFLLVGLEIKREMMEGELATWRRRALPGLAAAGGMIVPALIYVLINLRSPDTLSGWAIPSATDIAFALAVLSLLGPRVPVSVKVFLTALAILDDLGAIAIIAGFYGGDLEWTALLGAGLMLLVLFVLNRLHVMRLWIYLPPALALWWFMLHSGIHPTMAGVAVAMTIPAKRWPARPDQPQSPLHVLEHRLGPWVAYLVLPLFALVNAGVEASLLWSTGLAAPAPLGVLAGLVIGKPVGVFGASWLSVKLGLGELPSGVSWPQLYGAATLAGIGFTMSLLIGLLAFSRPELIASAKAATLIGSVVSAIIGALILWLCRPKGASHAD